MSLKQAVFGEEAAERDGAELTVVQAPVSDEGAEDVLSNREGVIASRERWRAEGLSAEAIAALRQFGLSDADLAECRKVAEEVPIPAEDYYLFWALDEQVAGMRSMGRRLMSLAATVESGSP